MSDDTPTRHPFPKRIPSPGASERGNGGRQRDGDFDMRIAKDGSWFHEGRKIERMGLVKLFASVLRRDVDGGYLLVTPVERGTIIVEDAPFVAVSLDHRPGSSGDGSDDMVILRTNLDEDVAVGPENPIRVTEEAGTAEPRPYVLVRDGLEALILRPVFYELVEAGVERDGRLGIWSGGMFFDLGPLEDPADSDAPEKLGEGQ